MYLKRETKLTQLLLDWNRRPPQKGADACHTCIHSFISTSTCLLHYDYYHTDNPFRHEPATDDILVDLQRARLWF